MFSIKSHDMVRSMFRCMLYVFISIIYDIHGRVKEFKIIP